MRRLLRVLVYVALPGLLLLSSLEAHAAIPRILSFLCENAQATEQISSASSANFMPQVYQSITAQYSVNDAVVPNQILYFYVTNTSNVPSSLITLDRDHDITDADGKCHVVICGSGASVTDGTDIRVYVKAVNPNTHVTIISSFVTITIRQYHPNIADSPWEGPIILPSEGIEYNMSALNKMASYTSTAIGDWTDTHYITFAQNNANYQLYFEEFIPLDHNLSWYGQTLKPFKPGNPNPYSKIQYNMWFLDANAVTPHNPWTPFGWRFDIQDIADHEIGHFLGVGHNEIYGKSLMYPNDASYFVWGTVKPRTESDWSTIFAYYPYNP